MDLLEKIIARKRIEVSRRETRSALYERLSAQRHVPFSENAVVAALSRQGQRVNIIAEVKFRSPSAGAIHPGGVGSAARIGAAFAEHAAAVSVLADGPGFGGGALTVRRVSQSQSKVPVLFKEFVLSPVQLHLARCVGASMVLLLVRVLSPARLIELIDACRSLGLTPLVEAADERELDLAQSTSARLIGINARDLRTFTVDVELAQKRIESLAKDRVAILMSGLRDKSQVDGVSQGRADAVLIGEGVMRARNPAARLAEFCGP